MGHLNDTICAIATPIGEGGVGIIRVSGPRSLEIASNVVALKSGLSLGDIPSHTLCLGDILLSTTQSVSPKNGNHPTPLDQVLVAIMRAPKSFTGENTVEIHCHGGQLILSMACEAVIQQGARLAEPGEFTRRAFLNGRMDLTQAEAVLDTIRATTSAGLKVAQEQLRGKLSKKIEHIRDELIRLLANIEAGMDFVEEDISFISPEDLERSLKFLLDEISTILNTAGDGRLVREGLVASIIGKPNVGKSSLLNALLETDRAIVSSVPGTTRDVLEEEVKILGVCIRLIDTAGLRHTQNEIEIEGIRRTTHALEQAGLLLIVVDGSQELSDGDVEIINENCDKKKIVVLNKADLPMKIEESTLRSLLSPEASQEDKEHSASLRIVTMSAKTGMGLEKLRQEIRSLAYGPFFESGEPVFITRLRHKLALERAKEAVTNTLCALDQNFSGECLAVDLRVALDALGEIIGVVSTEDILDHIFKEFCIGK
ncbi:MAG: tRNA uridine-5-carboxymethylaminomethyl(34) synthesis GTPase MnmE [Nitrospirota bacterium]|nr:MAG: tRNA uridine-5-carboxymethylaminomethyl(34) synthesis GTPase MnmE [Nitrospirota bacterium]